MTYADGYQLRTTNVTANLIANAVDGLLTRFWGGTTAGTLPAYTCSTSPTFSASDLVSGTVVAVIPHSSNTASSTLNVNSTGNKPIVYMGQALVGGEMRASCIAYFMYDGTSWVLLNHSGGFATFASTLAGNGTITISSSSTVFFYYQRNGRRVEFSFKMTGTTGGSASNSFVVTLPLVAASVSPAIGQFLTGYYKQTGVAEGVCLAMATSNSLSMVISKPDFSNFSASTIATEVSVNGVYFTT